MRQDLQIDARLVHLADAQRAKIVEPLDDISTRARTAAELLHLGILVVLFERDDVAFLCHSCLRRMRSPSVDASGLSFSVSAIPYFASSICPSSWVSSSIA